MAALARWRWGRLRSANDAALAAPPRDALERVGGVSGPALLVVDAPTWSYWQSRPDLTSARDLVLTGPGALDASRFLELGHPRVHDIPLADLARARKELRARLRQASLEVKITEADPQALVSRLAGVLDCGGGPLWYAGRRALALPGPSAELSLERSGGAYSSLNLEHGPGAAVRQELVGLSDFADEVLLVGSLESLDSLRSSGRRVSLVASGPGVHRASLEVGRPVSSDGEVRLVDLEPAEASSRKAALESWASTSGTALDVRVEAGDELPLLTSMVVADGHASLGGVTGVFVPRAGRHPLVADLDETGRVLRHRLALASDLDEVRVLPPAKETRARTPLGWRIPFAAVVLAMALLGLVLGR
jgi:hypothetical protein